MNSKLKTQNSKLDTLVAEVLAASKYRQLAPELVRLVGTQVLRTTPQLKAAVKETKSRLHQSAAAYVRSTPRYDLWLRQLEEALARGQGSGVRGQEPGGSDIISYGAPTAVTRGQEPASSDTTSWVAPTAVTRAQEPGSSDIISYGAPTAVTRAQEPGGSDIISYGAPTAVTRAQEPGSSDTTSYASLAYQKYEVNLKPLCLQIMAQHASTYERIPHLEEFYAAIFARLGPVAHILDLGCGLNPLALPWMPLSAAVRYDACDVFADMVAFVQDFLRIIGNAGQAFVCDLTQRVPEQRVDCVLALKLLPVLEQLQRGSALRLLEQLNSSQIVISYPTQSLGGRNKGMAANYERQLRAMLEDKPWGLERVELPGELVFVVNKIIKK